MIQKHVSWMVTLVCACTMLLGACGGTPSAEGGKSRQAHIYTVGTNAEFAPLESLGAGGQVEGFDIDLLNAMARTGGFQR